MDLYQRQQMAANRRGGVQAPRNLTAPQGVRPRMGVGNPAFADNVIKPLVRQGASILGAAGGVRGGIVDPALSAIQSAADSLLAPSAPKPPAVTRPPAGGPAMNPLAGVAADRAGIVVPGAPSALRPPMPASPPSPARPPVAAVAPVAAAAAALTQPPQISAGPRQSIADIEAQAEREFMSNLEADPTRQAFNAQRAAQIAAMQATQGRLAQAGAAALGGSPAMPGVDPGLSSRMTGIGDTLNNRALGRSGIAGNMQGSRFNTGSTAFAGPGAAMLDVEPRQSSFDDARRQAAIQMMGSDPNAVASRERMQATYGPVADPSVVLAGGLPAMARRNDLTSEQKMAFADRRNAFRAEREQRMADSAGWRAARAQARRGFVLTPEGSLDQLASMGLRDPRMAVAARQAQLAERNMAGNEMNQMMTQNEAARRAMIEGRRLDLLENEQQFNQDPARIDEQIRIRSAMTPNEQLEFDAKQMEMEDIRKQRVQQPVMDAVEGNRELRELGVDDQIERFADVKAAMSAGGMPAAIEAAAAYTDDQLQAMLDHDPMFFGSAPDEATKQIITQILAERRRARGPGLPAHHAMPQ